MYNPLKYIVNTINKKHLNIPRCRINPKKKDFIVSKVYGIRFPVKLAGLVRYFMQIKGNFDLTVVFTGVTVPTTLREIGWPKASFAKASFSQF